MIASIIGLTFLAVMVGGFIWNYRYETKEWNNGICAELGQPWRHFDMDSGGGHGYVAVDPSTKRRVYMWANRYLGPGLDLLLVNETRSR